MELLKLADVLASNVYPGRGIVIGKSADGKNAIIAYFIMGRSENSRNRIFVEDGDGLKTKAFDESKVSDPSLIIYAPVRVLGKSTIVTNGDQTDTIYDFMKDGKTFEEALRTRCFEPDAPNFTPRISGIVTLNENGFEYKLSTLKSADGNENSCQRFFYEYSAPVAGEGHFIHTYLCDGNPIPSFEGAPERIEFCSDINCVTDKIWNNLNEENKVSLFVRFINIEDGTTQTKIVNKNI